MKVFVDTSALYAVFDADDSRHKEACEIWHRLTSQKAELRTTNYVLVELSALLQRRCGMAAVGRLYRDVVPILGVSFLAEADHRAAAEVWLSSARRQLSLVDCTSFLFIRTQELPQVFCFDDHFREQGFDVLT